MLFGWGGGGESETQARSNDYSRYLSTNRPTCGNGRIYQAWIKSSDHKAIYLGHVTVEICKLVLIPLKDYSVT